MCRGQRGSRKRLRGCWEGKKATEGLVGLGTGGRARPLPAIQRCAVHWLLPSVEAKPPGSNAKP